MSTTIPPSNYERMTPEELKLRYHITDDDLERIREYGKAIQPRWDQYLEAFMDWVAADPEWSQLFGDGARSAELRKYQHNTWSAFFSCYLDQKYVAAMVRRGEGNASIGMSPAAYFTSMHQSAHLFTVALYDGDPGDPTYLAAVNSINKLVQLESVITLAAFVRRTNQIVTEQHEAMLEMSTPVTEIWEDILLLPVVGIIDSKRAQEVMTSVLSRIAETRARSLIIDISGVAVVDTAVANHLIKIVNAARLMGCTCTISGLSPAIAQTIVELGINVRDIRTTSKLKDALEIAFHESRKDTSAP